jgi:hypothetical protein
MMDGLTPQAATDKVFKRVEEIFAKYPIASPSEMATRTRPRRSPEAPARNEPLMTAWGHDPVPLSSEAIVRRETMGPIERTGFDAPRAVIRATCRL